MNWGKTKSFSFCANSVFHPWWWLLVLGIKCWEFLLKTGLWYLWPWNHRNQVGAAFGGAWGARRSFWAPLPGSYHNLGNAGEKLILGNEFEFFWGLIFPAAALCSPDALCRCRAAPGSREWHVQSHWWELRLLLMSCTTSISCIFRP